MGKRLGTFRAYFLVCVCCTGSFLFAYDTGIVGGILTEEIFQKDWGYSSDDETSVNSNCVSVLQAGAFFGCFIVWPITSRWGRRLSLALASFVFCIGSIMQVVKSHSMPVFYVGRVISGLGVGAATVLVPIYSAEMAPKNIRGKLGSFFQLFFALGVMVSYWVDYGVKKNIPDTDSKQWQIPIGLQFVPGGLLGFGMLLLKESTRWLAKQGRMEEALESLIWVRGGENSLEVKAEFAEIQRGIEEEVRATEGVTWREMLLPANRYRLFIAFTMQLCQQLTGNTSLAYYAPQIFSSVGASYSSMLVTGIFGVVKVVSVSLFFLFLVERVGRKWAFMGGAFAMGCFMLIIGVIDVTKDPSAGDGITSAGIASIAMIYLEAASYNMSWGPLAWLYLGEIFSNRVRDFGVALGAGSQWLWNFVMSQVTPHALENIGWRTFLMFAIFNYANVIYAWVFLRETKGRSLEEMEIVFKSAETAFDVEEVRRRAMEGESDSKGSDTQEDSQEITPKLSQPISQ
ncbi:MAG: hypothetical protein M1834_007312 [Cirrosporium novae-zelandiae]|nr:MAG: hypothetical protein M1834_007312 [Cirrosporium novae-zelandiae]